MDVLQWKWWSVALRGLAAMAFGVIALLWPDITVHVLIVIFGLFVLIDGIFELYNASNARRHDQKWAWLATRGCIGVFIGIIAFAWWTATATVFLYIIAIWAIVSGVGWLVITYRFPLSKAGKWLLGLGGLISVIFGIVLIAHPAGGATAVIWLIGAYAIVFGVIVTSLGYQIMRLQKAAAKATNYG
jgi:uncharacterized membrane protein HdeD (DUF308 family)